MNLLERAQQLLDKGYTPLPLIGKAPAVSGWQNLTGVTMDTVRQWQSQKLLRNLGLRTGDNGLVVLDFDGLGGYQAFVKEFPDIFTHTVKTGSGHGMHVYLIVQGEMPASTGQLSVPDGHIEIKAKGRQVVVPPSVHPDTEKPYTIAVAAPIATLTNFEPIARWIAQHNPKPEPSPPLPPLVSEPTIAGSHQAYARAALNNLAAQLAGEKEGERNNACNRAAWKLACYVRHGDLTEGEVRAALEGAMVANGAIAADGHKSFEATFRSGFQDGYSDTSYEPDVYHRQNRWNGQKRPDRELPGAQAYQPPPTAVSEAGVVTIGRTRIIKRTSLFAEISEIINNDEYIPPAPPIIFPFTALHKFGGQARVSKPGKIIILAGASGSGKTSALETIADLYIANDIPVWLWSPEWTPGELAERAIQRFGGATQDELYLREIDLYRANVLNQPSNPFHRLSDAVRQSSALAMRTLRAWETDVYFLHNELLSVDELAEVIAGAQSMCNPFPRVLIVDYAQLMKANDVDEKDEASIYQMILRFKSLTIRYGLIGILATQTTKDEARRNIKQGEFKGTTVIHVSKNSRGKKGKVRVLADPDKLRLLDQEAPDQTFSPDDHHLDSQSGRWLTDHAANLFLTLNPEYEEA